MGLQRPRDHEPLTVVVGYPDESEPELRLPPHRPGRVAGQKVDLAVGERLEPGVGGERNELDLVRIAENGGRDGAAEIDVEPAPCAAFVDE